MANKFLNIAVLFSSVIFLTQSVQTQSAQAQNVAVGASGEQIQIGNPSLFDPGASVSVEEGGTANIGGNNVDVNIVDRKYTGYFMPDGNGGMLFTPGKEVRGLNPRFIEAREIKLKVRELADQLTTNLPESLRNSVFLPVSFVNQDNMDSTSSFGRYIAEQLYFEFNQRGMKVQEYRLAKKITLHESVGETALTRALPAKPINCADKILAVGTYFSTRDAVLLNARLVRGNDGAVISSANLVFKQTKLSRGMLANRSFKGGKVNITSMPKPQAAAAPTATSSSSPFDFGHDIH